MSEAAAEARGASRLQQLIAAHGEALDAGTTDIDRVLKRLLEIAMEISQAEFGAIGVIGGDGLLSRFVHKGFDRETVSRIGDLPRGAGLLGTLIEEDRPLRLDDLGRDPRSSGFPANHPAMRSFLGVPIRIRRRTYGNFYLTHSLPSRFTDEHEGSLIALASTAGIAIDHAKLITENRLRLSVSEAISEISSALVAESIEDALPLIANHVAQIVNADAIFIAVPRGDDEFVIELARGEVSRKAEGWAYPREGSLSGMVVQSGQPTMAEHGGMAARFGMGPIIVTPLSSAGVSLGALITTRHAGAAMFDEAELSRVADFASATSVALVMARNRVDRERLRLLEDRSRIARDLHDHVIQRLFAAGLNLQAALPRIADPAVQSIVSDQVGALDAAIGQIRTAIFAMTSEGADQLTLRHRIFDTVGSIAEGLPATPQLSFAGAVDLLVPPELHDDVLAVIREGLANAVRHAAAANTAVVVTAGEHDVEIEIADDGIGMPERPRRRSGTRNLADRAESWGGSLSFEPNEPRGTRLVWRVPYRRSDER